MSNTQRLNWNMQPLELLGRWPRDVPVAALMSGDDSQWSRFSVIGAPSQWRILRARDGMDRDDALAWIRSLEADQPRRNRPAEDGPPIGTGWFTQLSYELGAVFEPAVERRDQRAPRTSGQTLATPNDFPLAQAARCDQGFVFDHVDGTWWSIGGAVESIDLRAIDDPTHCECLPLAQEASDTQYARAVERAISLIHAGDLFQANIARRWRGEVRGCPRAFALHALASSRARYGAWLETPLGMLASMSPELFLALDAGGRVVTRPIKGTRVSETDSAELIRSEKDSAELHMIVDLMRNDLSRACEPGSVLVREARSIETHGTVVHGVAEIHGQLRRECDRAGLLEATFPPGSITGAPKIRAMQVIQELEDFQRGPYCGAIGYLADTGAMTFSVAIRTASLHELSSERFGLSYAAGCGIVSDSIPDEEVFESHAKVRVLERAMQFPRSSRSSMPIATSAQFA